MSKFKRLRDFSDFMGFCKRSNPDLHRRLNKIGKKPLSQFCSAPRPLRPHGHQEQASTESIKPES